MLNRVESRKIEIAAIHDVDGRRLDGQLVEDIDIVNLARGNDYDRGNIPMQIQEGMEFDGSLAFSELRPGKQ